MPTNDMGSHKREPDLLRFTIALQRPDGVNYTSDYYRQQFSATFQDNFAPEKGYLGYDYHYELRFDEFIRETSREEWRFVLKSVEGFAELGLRVVVEGYSIFIEGKPTRAFDGKIEVCVLPDRRSVDEVGSFSVTRPFVIFGRRVAEEPASNDYGTGYSRESVAPGYEPPHHVTVIRSVTGKGARAWDSTRAEPASARRGAALSPYGAQVEESAPEWKNLPPPVDAPYQVENAISQGEQICLKTPLTILGASQRGRSHAHEGKFREDAFSIAINREKTSFGPDPEMGWHIFVVSDGAGSAKFSRRGSQLVSEVVSRELSRLLNQSAEYGAETTKSVRSFLPKLYRQASLKVYRLDQERMIRQSGLDMGFYNALSAAYRAIYSETTACRDQGVKANLADFSATALCVAMKRFAAPKDGGGVFPTWVIASYWVGDGALALYRPNFSCDSSDAKRLANDVLLLGRPDGGEYAGETRFLTSKGELDSQEVETNLENVRRRMSLVFVRNFEALFMSTDGVSDPFFEVEKQLADFDSWHEFWIGKFARYFPGVLDSQRTPRERAKALLDGMMFKERGHHDDRTAVIAINDTMVEVEGRNRNRSTRFEDHPYFGRGER